MTIIYAICAIFAAFIFAMPIIYPDAKPKSHNKGVK